MKVLDLRSSPFDVLSDRWVDRSGFGNHGKVYGAKPVSIAPGIMGYKFDGVDDYVDCGNNSSLDITDAITVKAWVKRDWTTADDHVIVDKRISTDNTKCWVFFVDANFKLSAYIQNNLRGNSNGIIPLNTWTHVAAVRDGDTLRYYINGKADGIGDMTGVTVTGCSAGNLRIGIRNDGSKLFNGTIAEFRIYNRALSAREIKDLYHNSPLYKLQRGLRYR